MENPFKRALAEDRPQIGLWSSLCSPVGAEIVASSGFDWIMFDTEHSPIEISGLPSLLRATEGGTAHAVVRPAWNDPVAIKRILDIGAQTLLVPFVQNAEEAKAAVAATRYPPLGVRGVAGLTRATRYGRIKDYAARAAENLCVLVQVETVEALGRLEDIAAVDGVDGVFIGPSDLSASMGHLGNAGHADVQKELSTAVQRIRQAGRPAGILASKREDALCYLGWGYRFVAAGVDVGMLATAADDLARTMREAARPAATAE